jgi:hypothetical protein
MPSRPPSTLTRRYGSNSTAATHTSGEQRGDATAILPVGASHAVRGGGGSAPSATAQHARSQQCRTVAGDIGQPRRDSVAAANGTCNAGVTCAYLARRRRRRRRRPRGSPRPQPPARRS